MAKLNLSQAAKVTGKNRTTIWRHINSGKLSAERDRDGLPFVDTSELIRVYGELTSIATDQPEKKSHEATSSYSELIAVIEGLRKEQSEMKAQLTALTNRLPHVNNEPNNQNHGIVTKSTLKSPEEDPFWPKEVKSMTDIILRNEIKEKYKKLA
jgi:hypothetical protein